MTSARSTAEAVAPGVARTIGDIARPARLIDAALTCAEVERVFQASAETRSVIVDGNPRRLLNRSTFFQALSGALGYGRPLLLTRSVSHLPDVWVPVFPAHTTIERAAMDLAASELANVLDDVLVSADDGSLSIASVSRVFYEVSRSAQASLAELSAAERRFRALVERSDEGVAILDGRGRPTYVAPGSHAVFGGHPGDGPGAPSDPWFEGAFHPDDRHVVARSWRSARRVGHAEGQLRMLHIDGSWRDVEFRLRDLSGDAGIGGVVVNYRDVTERAEMLRRIRHAATHDALTGLLNRSALLTTSAEQLADENDIAGISMVFVDLDGFKLVNDSYGHLFGDRLLCAVASRLSGVLGDGDSLGRWGGDEFLVVVRGDLVVARSLAERLMLCFRRPFSLGGIEVTAGASIGVAGRTVETSAQDLVTCADGAMYAAKRAGGGRILIWQANLHDPYQRRHLATDLSKAIDEHQIAIVVQPIISLPDHSLSGVEVLARWDHPTRGAIQPAEFIELAEKEHLIASLGSVILESACSAAAEWRDRGLEIPVIGINLSPRQLHDVRVVDELTRAFARHGLPIDRLCVEITEGALIDDFESARTILQRLRAAGVRVAIDDFGVGYSSLGYLSELPIDIIKIDRMFVDRLGRSVADNVLMRGVVQLAHSLGFDVIAEGIETAEQLALVTEMGVDRVQGYFLCPPIAPAHLVAAEVTDRNAHWCPATADTSAEMMSRSWNITPVITSAAPTRSITLGR